MSALMFWFSLAQFALVVVGFLSFEYSRADDIDRLSTFLKMVAGALLGAFSFWYIWGLQIAVASGGRTTITSVGEFAHAAAITYTLGCAGFILNPLLIAFVPNWSTLRNSAVGVAIGFLAFYAAMSLLRSSVIVFVLEKSHMELDSTMVAGLLGAAATLVTALFASLQVKAARDQVRIAEKQLDQSRELAEKELAETRQARDEAMDRYLTLREAMKDGPRRFLRKFENLIDEALNASASPVDSRDFLPKARAIVSQRDALRSALSGLDKMMNSDIDTLQGQLNDGIADRETIRGTVVTLKAGWSMKEDEVAIRVRQLFAQLEVLLDVDTLRLTREGTSGSAS